MKISIISKQSPDRGSSWYSVTMGVCDAKIVEEVIQKMYEYQKPKCDYVELSHFSHEEYTLIENEVFK